MGNRVEFDWENTKEELGLTIKALEDKINMLVAEKDELRREAEYQEAEADALRESLADKENELQEIEELAEELVDKVRRAK
jgi:predicted nuclease with TOPRIM domain